MKVNARIKAYLLVLLVLFLAANLMNKPEMNDNSAIPRSKISTHVAPPDSGDPISSSYGLADNSGYYKSHYFVWPAAKWEEATSKSKVCLLAQGGVDRIFWVVRQAEAFAGPVSMGIFVAGSEYAVAVEMVTYIRKCFPPVRDWVSFHIMYPADKPPKLSPSPKTFALNCSDPEGANRLFMSLRDSTEPMETHYPQNHMRNVARKACPCDYIHIVDIDMLATPRMAENLNGFLKTMETTKPCDKCIYVVPAYEVHESVKKYPDNKKELLELVHKGLAQVFHVKVYDRNQGNGRFPQHWEVEPTDEDASEYRVLYDIPNYQEFWEPLMVLPYTAPWHDERFVGFGFNRNSHMFELNCLGYKFNVLDRAFLVHRGFQTKHNYPARRYTQLAENRGRYASFKNEIRAKYGC
ncbi:beta-1,4-glucuronyltransferase 1-like [Penaeus chinensis]|uniref:beta-1,4-glucuronyltransferase 1-like n=1 Tax=Penaeus chinensis TaxID=139456 RepID=UPI001FB7CC55|nr:beta-1,4-glucuronyltransferase 1-like [Penaeus chinensis]